MGSFYGSIHVRTEDRDRVLDAAGKLARRPGTAMLVGPVLRGWVGVYPAGNGQDDRVSALLAKRLPGDVLHLIVHDDDIFAYFYYRDGKVVDRYNSVPDYFSQVSAQARARVRGRPEGLAHLLSDAARLADLTELLRDATIQRLTMGSRHLERFAELLGIANAAEAYEYLREQDGEGVEAWAEFTHVPDLSEERGRQLARAADIARVTKKLQDQGILRHVESRPGNSKEFSCTPYFCPDGANGFLAFWFDWQAGERRPVEHYQPPWSAPGRPTGVELEPSVTCIARSPSGRFLGVGNAYGGHHAQLWDLSVGQLVRDVTHSRVVLWVGFSHNENLLVTLGVDDCVITSTDTGERVAAAAVPHAKVATVHPDGTVLVGDQTGRLHFIDPATGAICNRLVLGHRALVEAMRRQQHAVLGWMLRSYEDPESQRQSEALLQQMEEEARQMAAREGADIGPRIDVAQLRQQMEATRASLMQQRAALESDVLPQQGTELPSVLSLSRNGCWLAIGASRGLRVYEWAAVRDASNYMPDPSARLDTMSGSWGGETNYVYAVAWQPDGQGVFFGGLDGRIEYLDLATRTHRILCVGWMWPTP